jgi:hypothetical protein
MQEREAPCPHCKKPAFYPAADVGMPYTCKYCRLSFDLPDGRPAEPRAPSALKVMCPKCSFVLEYLEELAGKVMPCPQCQTSIKLPELSTGPKLELMEEEEEERPKAKGQQPVIRGKKGFGRAIVPMSGPRLHGPTRDPARAKLLMQATVLVLIAGGLALGGFLLYSNTKRKQVDYEMEIRKVAQECIDAINAADADAVAQLVWSTPATRQDISKKFQEQFAKFQYRISDVHMATAAILDDGSGLIRIKWNLTVTEKATSKSGAASEEREVRFVRKDGRWVLGRMIVLTERVPN